MIWTGLLDGSYRLALSKVESGDINSAAEWFEIREYNSADIDASDYDVRERLKDIQADRAREIIKTEMLNAYLYEIRRSLKELDKTYKRKFALRSLWWAERVSGFYRILENDLREKLGDAYHNKILKAIEDTDKAIYSANWDRASKSLADLEHFFSMYAPARLSEEQIANKARLLARFLKLIHKEYSAGVSGGKINIPLEYYETEAFMQRTEVLFAELRPELLRGSPQSSQKMGSILLEMKSLIKAVGSESVLKNLSAEAMDITLEAFGIQDAKEDYQTSFQIILDILNEIRLFVRAGDYQKAELKRLEAYAFFDPDIEQRLFPRNPLLSMKIESLFWEGSGKDNGLGFLLNKAASDNEIEPALEALSASINEAKRILTAKLTRTSAFIHAFIILLREGLEAILVLAVILGILKSMGHGEHRKYLLAGVLAAVLASLATWYFAERVMSISTAGREMLEGITALLAAGVLVYVSGWIFHKTYVVDWVRYVREQVSSAVTKGNLIAMSALGFMVVYREGFETVLFYQALMIDSEPAFVMAGFLTGIAVVGLLSFFILYFGLKLPLKVFFTVTGAILMTMAVIFTGMGIRGFQTAGIIKATHLSGFPENAFLQIYLGIYPIAETLLAQVALAVIFIGGWLWMKKKNGVSIYRA